MFTIFLKQVQCGQCDIDDEVFLSLSLSLSLSLIPVGSPSRGGDVTVYVFLTETNRALPTPFYSVLVSISLLWPFQLYFTP